MATTITRLLACLCLLALPALAHDTGFGHSRRAMYVDYRDGAWHLTYRLRMNADEALVEMIHMDANGDGEVDADERERFLAGKARELLSGLRCLQRNSGDNVPGVVASWDLGPSLTQSFRFRFPTDAWTIALDDQNFAHKHGQIVIHTGATVEVAESLTNDLFHADRVQLVLTRQP